MNTPVSHFEPQLPALGAHLVTPRRGYTHHGIYVGGGRVIHYGGLSTGFQVRPVEEISLEEFAGGFGWTVRRQPATFEVNEIIRRARSRLGEDSYQLVKNNCEHFCQWCRLGRAHSEQVASWFKPSGLIRNLMALRRLGGAALPDPYQSSSFL